MGKIMKILKLLIMGFLEGMIYFIIYLILLPFFFVTVLRTPIDIHRYFPYLWLFIFLGTIVSILKKYPISIPLRILLKIVGIVILFMVLKGGIIEVPIFINSTLTWVSIDITPILNIVILASLIHACIDIFSYFSSTTET